MQTNSDWWSRCAFIRDYFFGAQRTIAQQLATYLAERYVGDAVEKLRPDTDVAEFVAQAIRDSLDKDHVTLAVEEDPLPAIDLSESITFMDLVSVVQTQRHEQG